ncbi:MAG: hypothetical protein JWN17_555 [Frankiales bacterium]|nr:hypothetical protein [Frankiales bacterium]
MEALAATPDVFETFFDHVGVGLALADLSSRFVRVNRTYAELLGRSPEDLLGLSFHDLLHPEGRRDQESRLTLLLDGATPSLTAEERYVRAGGAELWVLLSLTVVRDDAGRPQWFAGSAQDITALKKTEQELQELTAALTEQVVRDPLTGLSNRALLEERLRGALARDGRTGGSTGLLFLDLDGFKQVNDAHGHGVGDAVLRLVARRLLAVVRPSDTVARLGGDEFVVLVEDVGPEGLEPLARRLEATVSEPFEVGATVRVGVSVGTAISDAGEADAAGLLERADHGMYVAKRLRRH